MRGGYGQQPYQQDPYGQQPYGYGSRPAVATGRRVARIVLRIIGAIFLLIGLIFLPVSGCVRSVTDELAKARTAETTGTVVDIDEQTSTDSDGDVHTSRYPVLRFEDGDHVEHEGTQTVSTREYRVGEEVTVNYDPHDPDGNFMIAEDEGFAQGMFIIFAAVGGVIGFIGLVLLVVSFLIRR